jgi:glycosyltransferase involved in cell wall biosynthesis
LYRKIAFRLLNKFIIFNTSQYKKFISQNKLRDKNVFVSNLGVCTYLTKHHNHFVNNREYILFFGRITSYKGLEFLFPAMKQIHDMFPDVNLIVAGAGKFYFDISDYISLDYIDIKNRYVTNFELANLISNTLFVICPYNDATQSGVVMSSFAFCKPVLATNVGGLAEYIEHDKYGIIIEYNKTNFIVDAISDLLKNRKKLQCMKQYIYNNYFTGRYSWNNISEGIVSFYSSHNMHKNSI